MTDASSIRNHGRLKKSAWWFCRRFSFCNFENIESRYFFIELFMVSSGCPIVVSCDSVATNCAHENWHFSAFDFSLETSSPNLAWGAQVKPRINYTVGESVKIQTPFACRINHAEPIRELRVAYAVPYVKGLVSLFFSTLCLRQCVERYSDTS